MEKINAFALTSAAVSVLTCLLGSSLPKPDMEKYVKFTAALIVALVLVRAFFDMGGIGDIVTFDTGTKMSRQEAERIYTENTLGEIKEQLEKSIEDAAKKYTGKDALCDAKLKVGEDNRPEGIDDIYISTESDDADGLKNNIASLFGIDKDIIRIGGYIGE